MLVLILYYYYHADFDNVSTFFATICHCASRHTCGLCLCPFQEYSDVPPTHPVFIHVSCFFFTLSGCLWPPGSVWASAPLGKGGGPDRGSCAGWPFCAFSSAPVDSPLGGAPPPSLEGVVAWTLFSGPPRLASCRGRCFRENLNSLRKVIRIYCTLFFVMSNSISWHVCIPIFLSMGELARCYSLLRIAALCVCLLWGLLWGFAVLLLGFKNQGLDVK